MVEQLVFPHVLSADELYLLANNRHYSEMHQLRVHKAVNKLRFAQENAKTFLAGFSLPKATSLSPLVAALKAIVDADAEYCDSHGDDAEIAASNKKQNAIDAARKLLKGGAP